MNAADLQKLAIQATGLPWGLMPDTGSVGLVQLCVVAGVERPVSIAVLEPSGGAIVVAFAVRSQSRDTNPRLAFTHEGVAYAWPVQLVRCQPHEIPDAVRAIADAMGALDAGHTRRFGAIAEA